MMSSKIDSDFAKSQIILTILDLLFAVLLIVCSFVTESNISCLVLIFLIIAAMIAIMVNIVKYFGYYENTTKETDN